MKDLSVLMAARNEEFLSRTVEDVLNKKQANTEVIVVLDGEWSSPPIKDNPDVVIIHHNESVGQRAAINEASKLSKAKYIMKLDAHCIVDEEFDIKLMADCQYDWTVIPRMYNLHAFNWRCDKCKHEWYQGPTPKKCDKCDNTTDFKRAMVWKPRLHKRSDFMRFDKDMKFQYWGSLGKRPESQGEIADTMSFVGACWFMHRKRFIELEMLDERHGSWGQVGTEVSCKTWLSGGRLVVNKKTWFAHLFRTQGGDFSFPYPQKWSDQEKARIYSRDLWKNNRWHKQKHKLQWLIDKFAPIPDWHESNKGIIYYTDNTVPLKIGHKARKTIGRADLPITSCSLKPMKFGNNIHFKGERGYEAYFRQILVALENSKEEIVFLCEHDWLYHASHFDFTPSRKDTFYYNSNWWRVRASDGHAVRYNTHLVPTICGYRQIFLDHYRNAVKYLENVGFTSANARKVGFEPGTRGRVSFGRKYKVESFKSKYPNIDIRHSTNLTASKWAVKDFRNPKNAQGWIENDKEIPGWGVVYNRFEEFLKEI